MKTPQQVAAIFGCTPAQAAAQFRANAQQLGGMAARATNKTVGGFTRAQLAILQSRCAAAGAKA